MLPRLVCFLLLTVVTSCREASSDAAERVTHTRAQPPLSAPTPPCRGCTVDVPKTAAAELPILVVLYIADRGKADEILDWLERHPPGDVIATR